MEKIIKKIEKKFGKLPEAYRQWILLGVTSDERFTLCSVDWIEAASVLDVHVVQEPEQGLPGIFPIASFYSVCLWCIDNHMGGRVILCPHDEVMAKLYAPSVVAWAYRMGLEEAANFTDEDDIVRGKLVLWAGLIQDSQPEWAAHIVQLAGLPEQRFEYGTGVISRQEVDEIILKSFGQVYLDGEVEFLLPEEEDDEYSEEDDD
ncbi:SMI1/KNR4 family protein [Undibacterium sp. Di27W]|uniref:SMI1/KNR4 family protein n=1 Tax=Undibacterium sp. Di27W TaxID=3413036 RepID=UPI003BEFEE53